MSHSNATRCDRLRARCLAPRQPRGVDAAVSSQFWKTVRVAQHQAATPPCLSRGIRSTAVKMNKKLYIYFTICGPILKVGSQYAASPCVAMRSDALRRDALIVNNEKNDLGH